MINVALAFPEIKFDIEKGVILLQRGHRHIDEVAQQCAITRPPRL